MLDVIENENILQNVNRVGEYLGEGLRALAWQYELIGDVRGKGLFYGLELVRDQVSRKPATEEALWCSSLFQHKTC